MTDIRNAYGSVKHSLIHFILEEYRFPQWFRNLIKSMYCDLSVFTDLDGLSSHIPVTLGLFQGECLSVALFLLIFNPLLSALETPTFTKENGISRKGRKMTNISFADDMSIISSCEKGAQRSIDLFDKYLSNFWESA